MGTGPASLLFIHNKPAATKKNSVQGSTWANPPKQNLRNPLKEKTGKESSGVEWEHIIKGTMRASIRHPLRKNHATLKFCCSEGVKPPWGKVLACVVLTLRQRRFHPPKVCRQTIAAQSKRRISDFGN